MKLLIVCLRENGNARCWTSGDMWEHVCMGLAGLYSGIDRISHEKKMSFSETFDKVFQVIEIEKNRREKKR